MRGQHANLIREGERELPTKLNSGSVIGGLDSLILRITPARVDEAAAFWGDVLLSDHGFRMGEKLRFAAHPTRKGHYVEATTTPRVTISLSKQPKLIAGLSIGAVDQISGPQAPIAINKS